MIDVRERGRAHESNGYNEPEFVEVDSRYFVLQPLPPFNPIDVLAVFDFSWWDSFIASTTRAYRLSSSSEGPVSQCSSLISAAESVARKTRSRNSRLAIKHKCAFQTLGALNATDKMYMRFTCDNGDIVFVLSDCFWMCS